MYFFNQISTFLFLLSSFFFIGCQAASIFIEMTYKNYVTNTLLMSSVMLFLSCLLIEDFWKINIGMRYLNTQMFGVYGGHTLL